MGKSVRISSFKNSIHRRQNCTAMGKSVLVSRLRCPKMPVLQDYEGSAAIAFGLGFRAPTHRLH
jgi:hypothetical protein